MSYTGKSIYWVYFFDSQQIKTIQDLKFNESYNYKEIEIIVEEEPLFSFLKFEYFTNSIFNTPIKKEMKLLTALPTLSITYLEIESNSDCFSPTFSDNDSPPF